MKDKIKYGIIGAAIATSFTLVIYSTSWLVSSESVSYSPAPKHGYRLTCKNRDETLNYSVFMGVRVIEVVCSNVVGILIENRWSLHTTRTTDGEVGYWSKISMSDLLSDESEPFFCSGIIDSDFAYILIELIPLASKTVSDTPNEDVVKMSDQLYLLSWSILGVENSRYWDSGHPLRSSITYAYDFSDELNRKIIESNVAQLFRVSMNPRSQKATLKCTQHPKDV